MATAQQAIRAAEQHLETARFGLQDALTHADRAYSGIMNAVVFGRAVTFSLQNMAKEVPAFSGWYAKKVEIMRADPLMQYMVELRNRFEKSAEQQLSSATYFGSFSTEDIPSWPPGATGFFIGDQTGRNGFDVVTPDGAKSKYYITLPKEKVDNFMLLSKAPEQFRNMPATDVVMKYLDYLTKLVADARANFY